MVLLNSKEQPVKKLIIAVSVALASASVCATQSEIDDLRAGLHAVHMNTLTKYSESWGLEDRANIAKLQETKLDKTAQSATDAKQTSDLKGYADKKATSAYTTAVAHTDVKVARADADRKAGDDALSQRITAGAVSQSDRDAGQDTHINAVQNAAQIASVHADALAVRADGIEQRATVTDDRSINNAVRLDGAEGAIREETRTRASQVVQLSAGVTQAQSRADEAFSNAAANAQSIRNTNARVAEHSAQLSNHEQRIGELEQQTNRNFASLDKRIDNVKKSANAGTAAALSSASIPQVTEYQRFAVGAGVGGYEGEQAVAVGFSSRVSTNVVLKASVTRDTNQGTGWNVGTSIGW